MALNSQYSTPARNAAAAAIAALCNGGKLRIYDGAQPATADTALTTQNLLAEFAFANPAFGAAGSGIESVAGALIATVLRAGTATWARIVQSDGSTVVMDGTVGVSNANVILNAVTLSTPAQLTISSLSLEPGIVHEVRARQRWIEVAWARYRCRAGADDQRCEEQRRRMDQ